MRIGGQRRSSNIEQRGAGRTAAMGGGAAILFRLLFSRAGRRFIVPLIIIGVIAFALFPNQTMSVVGALLGGGGGTTATSTLSEEEQEAYLDRTAAILGSTEDVWGAIYEEQGGSYEHPTLVTYIGSTNTACGLGSAAAGPFYCPGDDRLYIDFSFYEQMERQLNAPGDFAQAYVIAHEVGHHIQNLQGHLTWSRQAQAAAGGEAERNAIQVRIELMADCCAGVWAGRAEGLSGVELEPGDFDEAIQAANAVGDDTLQRQAGRRVTPHTFTHGSAAQRMRWFRRGYESGDPAQCNTREVRASEL